MKNLSKNLVLTAIEANNWRHDEEGREILTCIELHFEFFGFDGFSAYVTDTALSHDFPDFQYIESEKGDLHDSFSDSLDEHWNEIVKHCKEFAEEYFKEQCELIK